MVKNYHRIYFNLRTMTEVIYSQSECCIEVFFFYTEVLFFAVRGVGGYLNGIALRVIVPEMPFHQ